MARDSAERAAHLRAVLDDDAEQIRKEEHDLAASRKCGPWRWRFVGSTEIQLRSKTLPTLRLDITGAEARDLMNALALAVNEPSPATPVISIWRRLTDWLARRTWNRSHEVERRYALEQMAKEFAENGGWQ